MFVETKREGEALEVTEQWQRVLIDAANYIEEHGWSQESVKDRFGKVCLLGAIANVHLTPQDKTYARNALREYLGRPDLAMWNDTVGRTKSEVVAVLRACASSQKE